MSLEFSILTLNVCEIEICVLNTETFLFLEELNRNSCVATASTALEGTIDPFAEESDDDDMRPIPPSLLQEEIFIPDSLPVPARATPVLPAPSKKEKQRRITNQEVLKLQAEVLQYHKEVLLLKKEKLQMQIQATKE